MRHWTNPLWSAAFGITQFGYLFVVGASIGLGKWLIAAGLLGLVAGIPVLFISPILITYLWLIGNPTLFVVVNNVLNVVPGLSLERALFALLFAKAVFATIFAKNRKSQWLDFEYAIVAYIVLLGFAALQWASAPTADINADLALYLEGFMMPMIGFMLIRRLEWTERHVIILMRLMVVAGIYQALLGIAGLYTDISLLQPSGWELNVNHAERATGTFANASEYGAVVSIFMIVALLLYSESRSAVERGALVAATGLMAISLVLCQTRAPWLGLVVMIAYLFLHDRRIRALVLTGAALTAFGGLIALPFFLESDTFARITELAPMLNRIAVWGASLNLASDHPLFGVGLGNRAFQAYVWDYAISVGEVSKNWAAEISQPHNEFLSTIVSTGISGLVLYLYILYAFFRAAMGIRTEDSFAGRMAHYAVAGLLSLVVNAMFVDLRPFYYFNLQVFSLLALSMALHLNAQPQTAPAFRSRKSPSRNFSAHARGGQLN